MAVRIKLTLAINDYDHVRDLCSGAVQPEGIEIVPLNLPVEEIFWRFAKYREWDVSEMSCANYTSLVSRGDDTMTAIPVFPSRVFRCSSIYARRDGRIGAPADLAGKRVGVPEWLQTAGVYARGYLTHQCGVRLADIEWFQGGVNQPGREEKINFQPPEGVKINSVRDRSLDAMLLAGELDAIISAHPPASFGENRGDKSLVRLFPDFQSVEEQYWRATGIFPIMHLIAIRSQVVRDYPWAAMNLYKAFEQAKERSVERLFDMTASRIPLPWGPVAAENARGLFGGDYWPYGVGPNRVTLDGFLQYCFEQGVSPHRLKPEELFAREVQSFFKL
ncbi:MAG: 4,5-dihydroxyphthalate decarboxylase [Candidatus Binataceae bacterium]